MDFWRTVQVLFRRWYITLLGFVASIALAATAYSAVPATYQSDAVLVLTTPLTGSTQTTPGSASETAPGTEPEAADGTAPETTTGVVPPKSETNPMLNFDRSLSLAGAILIQQMNSPETAALLRLTPGGPVQYQVTNGSTNPELLESGPFVFIHGTGPTPEAAHNITANVVGVAVDVLAERQDALKAPASTHIRVQAVVPTTQGYLLTGNPLRAAAAALALAGIGSLAAVYGFDSLMTYRRRRKTAAIEERTARAAADAATGPGAPRRRPLKANRAGSARLAREVTVIDRSPHQPANGGRALALDVVDSPGHPDVDRDDAGDGDRSRARLRPRGRARATSRDAPGAGR